MNITVLEESNLEQWDTYLHVFSASPLLSAPWLEAFRATNRTPVYFRFVNENKTIGILAGLVIEPSSRFFNKIDRTILFFSGPACLASIPNAAGMCLAHLVEYAKKNRYTSLDIRSYDYPYVYDLEELPFYSQLRHEYIVDMRKGFSDIQRKIKKTTRTKIRKAQRTGLTFHESCSPEYIAELMTLLEETKSIRLSKGYEDYPYFHMPYFTEETIRKLVINKIGRIFYVKKEDSLLCVQFTVSYGNRACALAIGKTQEAYKLGVHPFIMFNIMRTLKEEGYSALNLGPVANDSGKDGLISFKMSFGAEKQTCFGGTTSFLQGNFYNLLHQIYHNQLSVDTIKKALNRLSQ